MLKIIFKIVHTSAKRLAIGINWEKIKISAKNTFGFVAFRAESLENVEQCSLKIYGNFYQINVMYRVIDN